MEDKRPSVLLIAESARGSSRTWQAVWTSAVACVDFALSCRRPSDPPGPKVRSGAESDQSARRHSLFHYESARRIRRYGVLFPPGGARMLVVACSFAR